MSSDVTTALHTSKLEQFDRFTRLNVLGLLGQSLYESRHGNDERALFLLVTALVAFKSKKLSLALQGALVADRLFGGVTGVRPLKELFGDQHRRQYRYTDRRNP